jgi:hypothetical protein
LPLLQVGGQLLSWLLLDGFERNFFLGVAAYRAPQCLGIVGVNAGIDPGSGHKEPVATEVDGSRQDFEVAEPVRPINLKVRPVNREHPPDAFALGHPDQHRIGQVHQQVAGTMRWAEAVAITACYQKAVLLFVSRREHC